MPNTQPVGVAYSDPDLDRLFIDGTEMTATAAQLNVNAGVTAGTVTASKALVVDANKRLTALGATGWDEPNNYALGTTITAGTTQTQAGATLLTEEVNNVTTVATDLDGVRLPTASAGLRITVKNSGANILRVWPFSGDSINAMAVNLSVDLPTSGTMTFYAISATVWETDEKLTLQAPSTQKGSTTFDAQDNTGNTVTRITTALQAAARTYTVPDAGANASFVMSTGASTATTATSTEISKLTGIAASVTVVVTTPGASGTCDCAFTFKDAAGATVAFASAFDFYLSGVDGLTITAAITSILAADTPVGAVGVVTTGQQGKLVTTAAGLGSVKLTGTAATTYYITFIGPGGRLIISPALLTKA